jgi:hypothetical protein
MWKSFIIRQNFLAHIIALAIALEKWQIMFILRST